LKFEFQRVRFQFRAEGSLHFPLGKAGNTARGAFGSILRKQVCLPSCLDATTCGLRNSCPYARVFSPQAAPGEGPSGLIDRPRPFVFRASHLDGLTIRAGEPFYFDVHLFDVRDNAFALFVQAFEQLGQEGLGPNRARAKLMNVDQSHLAFDLASDAEPTGRARIRFVTPTELKSGREIVDRPEFAVLFARLRDRISTLRALYGEGPLGIDFRAMGHAAGAIRMTRCDLEHRSVQRRSSRTAQRHPLGGFVGEAEYEGELRPFVNYLKLGKWIGVGRQTVWGKGEIDVTLETERDCAPARLATDAAGRES
jgi:hypothetical protein